MISTAGPYLPIILRQIVPGEQELFGQRKATETIRKAADTTLRIPTGNGHTVSLAIEAEVPLVTRYSFSVLATDSTEENWQ